MCMLRAKDSLATWDGRQKYESTWCGTKLFVSNLHYTSIQIQLINNAKSCITL